MRNLRKALTVAEHKRAWLDARRAELHARGLRDAHIAEQMGYKPAYFSQVVNGATIGDGFIDKLCTAFGFRFNPSNEVAQSTNPDTITVPRELWDELLQQGKTNARLLNAVLDQLDKLKK